jgi:pyruvate carboxylase
MARFLTCSVPDEKGKKKVFVWLDGQTRIIEIIDKSVKVTAHENEKAIRKIQNILVLPCRASCRNCL